MCLKIEKIFLIDTLILIRIANNCLRQMFCAVLYIHENWSSLFQVNAWFSICVHSYHTDRENAAEQMQETHKPHQIRCDIFSIKATRNGVTVSNHANKLNDMRSLEKWHHWRSSLVYPAPLVLVQSSAMCDLSAWAHPVLPYGLTEKGLHQ